jgi:hypothetical protein
MAGSIVAVPLALADPLVPTAPCVLLEDAAPDAPELPRRLVSVWFTWSYAGCQSSWVVMSWLNWLIS